MRDAVALRDKYTCQICERVTQSGDCDHITPEAKGGKTEMENLQWLCRTCHEAKTIRDSGGTPKVAIGIDGWPIER